MEEKINQPAGQSSKFVEDVTASILEEARKSGREPHWKFDFHTGLQNYISSLAEKFGLCGDTEYPIKGFRPDGRTGKIDVAWFEKPGSGSGSETDFGQNFGIEKLPVAVFEIDSGLRKKSVGKLLAVDAPFRFWAYYGKKDAGSLLEKNDPEGLIKLIRVERPEFKKLV